MRENIWKNIILGFKTNKLAVVGAAAIILLALISIFAFLYPVDPNAISATERLNAPSMAHLFGTDDMGRDYLARCIYGGRASLLVGFLSMVLSTALGVIIGSISGFVGGTVDAVLLDLTLGRKASLTAAFDVKDLRMELTGGSSATLTGKAGYLTLFASTGRVAASGLEVMSAEVNAQSKADVSLWITDRFIGKTTTNARITYKGQPAVVRGGAKFMGGEISHVE